MKKITGFLALSALILNGLNAQVTLMKLEKQLKTARTDTQKIKCCALPHLPRI
jgi:hypothetical protein